MNVSLCGNYTRRNHVIIHVCGSYLPQPHLTVWSLTVGGLGGFFQGVLLCKSILMPASLRGFLSTLGSHLSPQFILIMTSSSDIMLSELSVGKCVEQLVFFSERKCLRGGWRAITEAIITQGFPLWIAMTLSTKIDKSLAFFVHFKTHKGVPFLIFDNFFKIFYEVPD